jgi:hypothetical protein
MSQKEYSKGSALILATLFGPFGIDKIYIDRMDLFYTQFFCTIFIIGLLFSGPYSFICMLTLTLSILFGINTFLYPIVNWGKVTTFDQVVAGIILIFVIILPFIFNYMKKIF